MTDVVVVVGAGAIGQAIARRVGAGRHVVLASRREEAAESATVTFRAAGFSASAATVDVSDRASVVALAQTAAELGPVTRVIHAGGVSPSQAPPATILHVDLYGTALVLEQFARVVASGGSGVVIASQSGYVLPPLTAEQERQLATTPAADLLSLPMLQPDQVTDPLHAYQLAKRANSLRVRADAVRWAEAGARLNAISPGIVISPTARDEMSGPHGAEYRGLIEGSPAGRGGTPDEIATVAALLLGPDGAFITGSDVLVDGGLTSAHFYGRDT